MSRFSTGSLLHTGLLSLALLPVFATGCSPQADVVGETDPPNILLYVVDTLRPDSLGTYGNREVATPHIDSIAAQGVVFDNAQTNASWTRASMASLFTGLYPPRHNTRTRADHLQEGIPTVARIFAQAGYTTGFVVANPNVGNYFGFKQGFRDMIELYQRRGGGIVKATELLATADVAVDEAISWIDAAQTPFFLTVMPIDPHAPYDPPEGYEVPRGEYRGLANGSLRSLSRRKLSAADRDPIRSLYDAEIAYSDFEFGRLIQYLRDRRLLDDTIVIFTSDHGEEFWEYGRRGHGQALVDTLLQVPLVVRYPGDSRVVAGLRREFAVELVDILPSLLDLAGLAIPEGLDGRTIFNPDRSETESRSTYSEVSIFGQHMSSIREYPGSSSSIIKVERLICIH